MGESPRTDNPRIDDLRRRVQADPASIAFAALAEEYRRVGRFEEAIETCTAGLKRHPSYLSAHVTLGRALIEVGRLDDADEELQLVLRAAPENLAAIRGLADIHSRRREIDHAGERVLDAHSDSAPAVAEPAPEPVSWAPPVPEPPPAVFDPPPEPPAETPIFKFKSAPDREPSPLAPEPDAFSFANTPSESAIEEWRARNQEADAEPREEPEPLPDDAVVAALEDFLSAIRRARANS